MPNRADAIQNAASLLSSFCGRGVDTEGAELRTCAHDHTGDAQAFVRMVEQYAFPEHLRELMQGSDTGYRARVVAKIQTLEQAAAVVEPR